MKAYLKSLTFWGLAALILIGGITASGQANKRIAKEARSGGWEIQACLAESLAAHCSDNLDHMTETEARKAVAEGNTSKIIAKCYNIQRRNYNEKMYRGIAECLSESFEKTNERFEKIERGIGLFGGGTPPGIRAFRFDIHFFIPFLLGGIVMTIIILRKKDGK